MKKNISILSAILLIGMLLLTTCEEGMFGSLEELEEQAIEENAGGQTYVIVINRTGNVEGDSVTATPETGRQGASIAISYSLADTERFNRVVFGGVMAAIDPVEEAGTGSINYTLNSGDADESGAITISAAFSHTAKMPRDIGFPNIAITKTYGDADFTVTILEGSIGGGAVTYTSSNISVATVELTTGTVHMLKASSTPIVITATKAADDDYAEVTTQYTLTINRASPGKPNAPTVASSGPTSITLNEPAGANSLFTIEYVRNTSSSVPPGGWQENMTFSGLTLNQTYYFFARYKEDLEKNYESAPSDYLTASTSDLLPNTISFPGSNAPITKNYGDADFSNTVTSGNPGATGAVTYTSSDQTVATVVPTSGLVHIVKASTVPVVITAVKAPDSTYSGATAQYSLTVNKKGITITGATVQDKTYDGNTTATINTGLGSISGIVGSDNVTISYASATAAFASAAAGSGKSVQFYNVSLGGANVDNYSLSAQPTTTATINTKPVTITGLTASKTYDGTLTVTPSGGSISGLISGETNVSIGYGTGTFDNKNVGTGKTVTFSGFSLAGTNSGNYSLSQPALITNGTITVRSITLSVGTPAALSPLSTTATFTITLSYVGTGDSLTVNISSMGGVTPSGNTGITSTSAKTVTLTYSPATIINPVTRTLALTIPDTNYILSTSSNVSVTVYDGQAVGREIPVTTANIPTFNTYASTSPGNSRYYKLAENITLSGNWTPVGNNSIPFTGNFDGNGNNYTISGLNITNPSSSYQGFFGYISSTGTNSGVVKNLTLANCNISITSGSYFYSAPVVGYIDTGLVENCSVTSGSLIFRGTSGGVVGYNNAGTIQKCFSNVTITAYGGSAGGIVGTNRSIVENCYTTGNIVPVAGYEPEDIGGIVGNNQMATASVSKCYAAGNISGYDFVGGIVGQNTNSATVSYCVALNPVIHTYLDYSTVHMGRVIGHNYLATISNNYARNNMTVTFDASFISIPVSGNTGTGTIHGADISRTVNWQNASWWTGIGFTDPWWTGKLGTGVL